VFARARDARCRELPTAGSPPRSGDGLDGSIVLGIRPGLKGIEGNAHDIRLVADVAPRDRGESHRVPRFERRDHLFMVFDRISPTEAAPWG
jgi:hypothetical protein